MLKQIGSNTDKIVNKTFPNYKALYEMGKQLTADLLVIVLLTSCFQTLNYRSNG